MYIHVLYVWWMLRAHTVVSWASAHGCAYFNFDFHRTGYLPCVKIEVGGVNVAVIIYCARVCMYALLPIRHIARTIVDGGCD